MHEKNKLNYIIEEMAELKTSIDTDFCCGRIYGTVE